MSEKIGRKLCASCDGFVDVDVIICPYCGGDVSMIRDIEKKEESITAHYQKNMSTEETLSSLYPPPYKPKKLYNSEDIDLTIEEKNEESEDISDEEDLSEPQEKLSVSRSLPIVLFSLGVNFLLIGLYLLIFSTNGEIFIRWNANIWPIYLAVGIPSVIVGYKMLLKSS